MLCLCVLLYFSSNFSHSLVLIDIGVISGSMLITTFTCCAVLCLVTQLWLTLCDLMNCSPPSSSVHGDSPGKNTGVGRHALLQGIFPIQGLNPPLLHCRQTLYCPSHQRSPWIPEWVAYPFSRGSSWPRDQTGVSCIAGGFFTSWITREAHSWESTKC